MESEQYRAFLSGAASPYHVVSMVSSELEACGFTRLREAEDWKIESSKGYYFVRDQSCVAAFVTPSKLEADTPFAIVGTHTDSPTLKLKPSTYIDNNAYNIIPVEPYGSPIFESWFDRPLRLGGRVVVKTADGLHSKLICFTEPIGVIPHLAIHMWPTRTTPPQMDLSQHIRVLISAEDCYDDVVISKNHSVCITHKQNVLLLKMVIKQIEKEHGLKESDFDIISWDLEFSDFIKPHVVGNYIIGEKQDNLSHCFTAMKAIINAKETAKGDSVQMVCMFNNEEVGSNTREGAMTNLIYETIKRITSIRSVPHSFVLSADVSHGLHPNYPNESDNYSRSFLGRGICLKVDSRCGYSSSGALSSVVLDIVNEHNKECKSSDKNGCCIMIQSVAKKNGTLGGSTIGPMTASGNHIRSCDVGIPLLAMHSICETIHVKDLLCAEILFSSFLAAHLDTKFFDELD